ncbi:MAG: metal-sensitive transcriptional regulator [Patescibacteria group bacterium]|jgi:DNA-binding FrmR family transcriptional regulator
MNNYQEKLLHRLKIIRGHLDKVIKMVEADEYCMDIMQQTTAVGSALKEAENMILENHLKTCVTESIVNHRGVEKKVDEVIKVFRARK